MLTMAKVIMMARATLETWMGDEDVPRLNVGVGVAMSVALNGCVYLQIVVHYLVNNILASGKCLHVHYNQQVGQRIEIWSVKCQIVTTKRTKKRGIDASRQMSHASSRHGAEPNDYEASCMYQVSMLKTAGYEQAICWPLLYSGMQQGIDLKPKCKKFEQRNIQALWRKQQKPETVKCVRESISTIVVWLEENSSTSPGGREHHVLSQTVHFHDMRAFVHEQAASGHVQTCIDLASVDILVRVRVEDTSISMQQDRKPLLSMSASTKRAYGAARATASSAIRRVAMESQLQRTASNARRKGRN